MQYFILKLYQRHKKLMNSFLDFPTIELMNNVDICPKNVTYISSVLKYIKTETKILLLFNFIGKAPRPSFVISFNPWKSIIQEETWFFCTFKSSL